MKAHEILVAKQRKEIDDWSSWDEINEESLGNQGSASIHPVARWVANLRPNLCHAELMYLGFLNSKGE